MGRFDVSLASLSDPGRRAGNEDAVGVDASPSGRFAVLCDGAGGHARGAEAARRSVATIAGRLRQARAVDPGVLQEALRAAHADLEDRQRGARGELRMHATVVVLWIDTVHDRAIWSHVGDSRLYRLRYGAVARLTDDDSVVQRLLAGGVLTQRQAESHPLKNQLIAALGMHGTLDPPLPDAAEPLQDGDAFLLCSDGWWAALDEPDIAATCLQADSPAGWLEAMRGRISARAAPDQDNYSAVAVWISDPQEDTHPAVDGDGA